MLLWKLRRINEFLKKKKNEKVGGYQSNKILPITELCHERGLVPGILSYLPSFQNILVKGDHCKQLESREIRVQKAISYCVKMYTIIVTYPFQTTNT